MACAERLLGIVVTRFSLGDFELRIEHRATTSPLETPYINVPRRIEYWNNGSRRAGEGE